MAAYIEFSLIEKLHARITEVSPANPGETINDAVERLIAECAELSEQVAKLRELVEQHTKEQHMSSVWLEAQVKAICK